MSTTLHTVIQTEDLSGRAADWLSARVNLTFCDPKEAEFPGLLAEASGLVIRTYTKVNEAMLSGAPKLRVVGRAGVGLDNVDLKACAKRGIVVVHTPDANTQAVIEYAFGCILEAVRPRHFMRTAANASQWRDLRNAHVAERQLDELTLGLYGMGRIGKRMAAMGRAFGMQVIYHDIIEIAVAERCGAAPVDRETLLREADVVSIHVDPRPANSDLVDGDAFGLMKPNVVFLNTARGMVVNPHGAARFLASHPKASGWFDVHEPEPFGANYPLLGVGNAHLSPHLASRTKAANERMSDVVYDVWEVLEGRAAKWAAEREE